MKFKNKTIEELEVMSFDDLAYEILKEKGKKKKKDFYNQNKDFGI